MKAKGSFSLTERQLELITSAIDLFQEAITQGDGENAYSKKDLELLEKANIKMINELYRIKRINHPLAHIKGRIK